MENLDSSIIPLQLNYFCVHITLHTESVSILVPTANNNTRNLNLSSLCSAAVEGKVKYPTISQSAFMTDDLLGCYWACCQWCRVQWYKVSALAKTNITWPA